MTQSGQPLAKDQISFNLLPSLTLILYFYLSRFGSQCLRNASTRKRNPACPCVITIRRSARSLLGFGTSGGSKRDKLMAGIFYGLRGLCVDDKFGLQRSRRLTPEPHSGGRRALRVEHLSRLAPRAFFCNTARLPIDLWDLFDFVAQRLDGLFKLV